MIELTENDSATTQRRKGSNLQSGICDWLVKLYNKRREWGSKRSITAYCILLLRGDKY
jgi:hypothetical protein